MRCSRPQRWPTPPTRVVWRRASPRLLFSSGSRRHTRWTGDWSSDVCSSDLRPRIGWIHTAQGQGEAVRAYTKWDYQPHTIAGVPEAFARAYAVMMTEPTGPIYMCYDAWLQEQKLDHEVPLPPLHAAKVPSRLAPDPKALAAAADLIAAAKNPVIIAEFVGREPEGFHALIELAETGRVPVYDVDRRLNFPTRHPLNMSMVKDVFRDADLVLCLDTRDWERPTTELASTTRELASLVPARAKSPHLG